MSLSDYKDYSILSERLGDAIREDKLGHAYIIEGDSLSGKENFALDFAKAVLCRTAPGVGCDSCSICRRVAHGNYQDLYQVESDNRSVKDKDVFQLQQDLMNVPTGEGERNIAIVPDADTMTVRAQNRFLKTLEEPQVGTLIMLLSENSDNLIPTIRSRCQTIRLYSADGEDNQSEFAEAAEIIIRMAKGKSYYFEVKDKLTAEVKDRKDALELLDAMEHIVRGALFGENSSVDSEDATAIIPLIEEARRDIKINVNYKYALGDLILKLK